MSYGDVDDLKVNCIVKFFFENQNFLLGVLSFPVCLVNALFTLYCKQGISSSNQVAKCSNFVFHKIRAVCIALSLEKCALY